MKYIILGAVAAPVATFMLPKRENRGGHPHDCAEIAANGTLRAATEYNSISFYVDGNTLSDFHYELVEAFAHDHSLRVAITPEMSFNERLESLAGGWYDVIAYGLSATSKLKDSLLLIAPIVLDRQILVQRKMDSPGNSLSVRSQLDLAGETLNMVKGSPSILHIRNLGNGIDDTIYINEIKKYGSERLIALVAHGDIDYAVCDEAIARPAANSLPQIDINTAISLTQSYSQGMSKQSPVLLDSLNSWLERFKAKKEHRKIYRKYYK